MCGLVGVMSRLVSEDAKKAFHDMLYLDVLRGEDSTGVAAISNLQSDKMEVEMFKSVGSTTDLFDKHSKNKKFRSLTYKPVSIYIGHNRFATQGAINEESAHPFEFENVVGAHNGTVNQHSMKDFNGYKEHNIDSKIIFSHLSHTRDINTIWKDADGAMALVYFDKNNHTLNLIRNKERPLHFVYSKDDKTLMWASESWMLWVAAGRQNIDLNDIVAVKPNTLYTFELTKEGKVQHTETDVAPFTPKPVQHFLPNYSQRSSNYYDDWMEDYGGATYNKPAEKKEKNHSNCAVIVTEFHDNPRAPLAMGFLSDGSPVKINISLAKYLEAKQRVEAKDGQWYFIVPKVYRTSIIHTNNDAPYWCHWADCRVAKLKPHMQIVRLPNKGFVFKSKQGVKTAFAPWYDEKLCLTENRYNAITDCGCYNCKERPVWADRESLHWIDAETFFCDSCFELNDVKAAIAK